MNKRLVAILLLGFLMISLTGCAMIWGTDKNHQAAQDLKTNKKSLDQGYFYDTQHSASHLEVMLRDFRKMHRFFDRHFMNYDWDDPYID